VLFVRLILVSLILLLSACNKDGISVSNDYLNRLQSVLEIELELNKPNTTLRFPQRRQLKSDNSNSVLSIREFLSLRQCKLHTVIAQRNSLMGKVALPSQLLFNDLQILQHAPACIEKLNASNQSNLAEKLVDYQQQKIQHLDHSLWQAILGEQENMQFWRVREQPANYPQSFNNDATKNIKHLLQFVQQVQHGVYDLNAQQADQIEQHLQQLSLADAGTLFQRLIQIKIDLEIANKVIVKRMKKPLCLTGQPTQKSRYFKNVVNQFFISKVQVEAVHLTQRYQQLMSDYLLLEKRLWQAAPKAYQQWKLQRDQEFQQALTASKTHVSHIKQLFEQCGLSVGL